MATIKLVLKQVRINFGYIAKYALTYTGSVIAGFEILGFLCDFNMVFPENWTFINRLLISAAVVLGIWCVLFIIKSLVVVSQKRVTVIDADNGHHVYVEYGDLLEDRNEKNNVVVTANRCFDTIVDDDLISATTIHGKAILKICTDGYTADQLHDALQNDLTVNRRASPSETLSRGEKRKGNLSRYPVGTIAEFKKTADDKTTYFFVGMSTFNSDLHPETTDEEYALTVQRLIEYCHLRSQRFPVYMPVIGTNGRNHKKEERELLEYMVSALRFHKHLVNTDIHIVVYFDRRDDVSIQGL